LGLPFGREVHFAALVLEDSSADPLGDLRDKGVAEGGKAVHSGGNPISHSTHVGFSCPVLWSGTAASVRVVPALCLLLGSEHFAVALRADFESPRVGVGQSFTAALRGRLLRSN
jgi:hypothetical protein